ncbi:ABC transporter permease [Ciceribacter sp. L1K23]|uniref:ABC transporter permease n=1 Tax=unclassified Ciceribacter TaxID=2628820 RepID=UPI001ABDFAA0|nr:MULTISPECIES: ABC transporter permease [unclassified Ciceribacter]MBO3758585.1 ABC transporter permease [Ciceribacter sp. L1K22]MBR0557462.1 ABC transporter permease [Ciceribacter sp. L1K23]
MDFFDILVSILGSTIRLSIPLIFTALAGLFSERAGIFDIGLEGKMLAAAFASATVAYVTGSPWVGLLAGILVSIFFSLIHGFASITNRGNQIVSGVAINFVAAGLTAVLGQAWFSQGGRTAQLTGDARFSPIILPGADLVRDIPIIGPLYANVISGNNILTYMAFLAVPLAAWVLYRTRFGLRLRAVGENPGAVDTAGISVAFLRYRAVIVAGFLCGFAGTYLAIAQSAAFIKDMSAGKGYIALAALIFAKWRPVPVLFACLLFGFLDALANFMQGKSVPLIGEVPVQIFQALPYILTCVLLAGFIGAANPPKAGGVPYVKER